MRAFSGEATIERPSTDLPTSHTTAAAIEAEALSKSGHKYNVAEQQQIYRSEVSRIWNQQRQALSRTKPPRTNEQDLKPLNRAIKAYESEIKTNQENQAAEAAIEDHAPELEIKQDAVLKIRRKVSSTIAHTLKELTVTDCPLNSQRDNVWHTEFVKDPSVIRQYMQQRRSLRDTLAATEALVPSGDAVLDAARQRRLAAEIAQLQKHQERRMRRKQALGAAGESGDTAAPKAAKATTKRSCGRCGAVGHTASNTACPLYPRPPTSQEPRAASPTAERTSATAPSGLPKLKIKLKP